MNETGFSSSEEQDLLLIQKALNGNKMALERLIKQHQDFIYNIALRLYLDPNDALDATQDVLIKVITHLKTFQAKSQFRTWLYRIVVNHFLNSPKRKYEQSMESLKGDLLFEEVEDRQVSEEEVEEVRIMCSTAMLMCLNREQRLIYIIGEIFNVDHNLGAELFGTTKGNFRIKLHRARMDLLNFVSGKCGLIDSANPCRCPKKTRVMVKAGMVDKENLRFNSVYTRKISDWVSLNREQVSDAVQLKMKELFRDSPYQVRNELDQIVRDVVT